MKMHSHILKTLVVLSFLVVAFMAASPSYAQYSAFGDPGASMAGGSMGAGGLMPVAPTTDGGKIPIGATAQVVVRFKNDGGPAVETGTIRLYPSSTVSAEVSMNQCIETPLEAGSECAVALSVKGLQAGPWRVEMLMSHSGRARLVTATVSGNVETSGDTSDKQTSDVEMLPDVVDFGDLKASQTLVEPVTLRNITSNKIDIKSIYIDTSESAGFSLKTECKSLDAGQACIAVVSWSPKQEGRSSGVLVVEHSGPAGVSSVPLMGEYTPSGVEQAEIFPQAVPGKGLLVSSQTEVDFGTDIDTTSTITVSLVNAGDEKVTLNDIRLSGSENGLSFKDNGCKVQDVLEPVEACPLTISWSPTRVGDLIDDVQILHDGARGVLVLPIRGEALSVVSPSQKTIVLSADGSGQRVGDSSAGGDGADMSIAEQQRNAAEANRSRISSGGESFGRNIQNPKGILDGYRITSFSPSRAIINGPGGSRIVFDNKEFRLGGVPWHADIQQDGIEFSFEGEHVLLLFEQSLSPVASTPYGSKSSENREAAAKRKESMKKETTSSSDEGANGAGQGLQSSSTLEPQPAAAAPTSGENDNENDG